MQPFSCQQQLWNSSNNLIEEIYIYGLEHQRWPLEFFISFSKIHILDLGVCSSQQGSSLCIPLVYLGFRSEVWLIPFGIMQSKSHLESWIFRIYIPSVNSQNTLLRENLLLKFNFFPFIPGQEEFNQWHPGIPMQLQGTLINKILNSVAGVYILENTPPPGGGE